MTDPVRTTCPYCGVGCGILATVAEDGRLAVRGDPDHPSNHGRLCSKGTALPDTMGMETRLLHPEVDGKRVDWDTAISAVADRFSDVIRRHGPDSAAFYLSGQLLTEDYYVANKLMKGFVGTANVDTNSRLCMASTVVGHRRAFGSDTVPGTYADLEEADLVVLVGSNLAWCHPVLHQRLQVARQQRGTRVIAIDPRRTVTAEEADTHLAIRPGSDIALFNGLLLHLSIGGSIDGAYVAEHVSGAAAALEAAAHDVPTLEIAAARCDLPVATVKRFYDLFAGTTRVVTVFSQGVNQSVCGTDTVNAIINVHLLTGRIGRPGMGPFSVTGQPNAMGGREVGGLANQLAAHMMFEPESVDRVGRFWNAPAMATRQGLKAVDMFRAIDEGRIKALWVMGTNPAVSLPETHVVRRALAKCEVVVVSDVEADTDTLRHAHIKLPAAAWGEKDGTVTNSDRTISRQRALLPLPGEAKPDWWIITRVAHAMGHGEGFPYARSADVFREHAALSAFENEGTRDFDIGAYADVTDDAYDALVPFKWPHAAGGQPTRRLFAEGGFFTPDARGHMIPVRSMEDATPTDADHPLVLNTGRIRDQWHTMTRTGKSPRLSAHAPEPTLAIHPTDARRAGLKDEGIVRIEGREGRAIARVTVTDAQREGEVFLPMHWNDNHTADCVVGALVVGVTDPHSGQPDSKRSPVRVSAVTPSWTGLLITAQSLTPKVSGYWSKQAAEDCAVFSMAGDGPVPVIDDLGAMFPALAGRQHVEYVDHARGVIRRAWFDGDHLVACVFIAAGGTLPDRAWLVRLVGGGKVDGVTRLAMLSGRPPADVPDDGRTVCACFGVGVNRIVAAIRDGGLVSVEAIGAALQAGTNCGSCIPELKGLLNDARQHDAVA